MRYAAAYKPEPEPLNQFIRRKGGINACADRFTRECKKANISVSREEVESPG
jgi:hypothetical protein